MAKKNNDKKSGSSFGGTSIAKELKETTSRPKEKEVKDDQRIPSTYGIRESAKQILATLDFKCKMNKIKFHHGDFVSEAIKVYAEEWLKIHDIK